MTEHVMTVELHEDTLYWTCPICERQIAQEADPPRFVTLVVGDEKVAHKGMYVERIADEHYRPF